MNAGSVVCSLKWRRPGDCPRLPIVPCFEYMPDEPVKMLAASGVSLYEFMLNPPVLYRVPDVFFKWTHIGIVQYLKICKSDMSGFMINEATDKIIQLFISIHR